MAKVNLDALIQREDFAITEPSENASQNVGTRKDTLSINDLRKDEFFFSVVRKPDFQRETNEWEPAKTCGFIVSFLDGDLIPAVILWRSASSNIFVIDGSHRLSALAAWINDDYGDGPISTQFYDGIISEEQRRIAHRTRNLVNKTVGSFADHTLAASRPDKVRPEILGRARRLAAQAIQLQWVEGDSSKAESSFFKINQQASPIDGTELRVLKSRRMPSAIAARSIMRSGRGHKYWSAFIEENQAKIEDLANEINMILFHPESFGSPVKTLDLPTGGKAYSAHSLALVLDFVNIVNGVAPAGTEKESPDEDGSATIDYLTNCRRIARMLNSNHPSSLGLHPAVYFYAPNGHYKIASFFAVTALMSHLDKHSYFPKFIEVRRDFEALLIKYDFLTSQIVRHYRSAFASYLHIRDFYIRGIAKLAEGRSVEETVSEVMKDPAFSYLASSAEACEQPSGPFSPETKSEAYIRQALPNTLCCEICGGYIHRNSISIDHIDRKGEGGSRSVENAQLAHPYCNITFKH